MFKTMLVPPVPAPPRIMAAYQGWFTTTGTKHVPAYDSADPRVIEAQILKAKNHCQIDAFSVDGYGYAPDFAVPTNQNITAMRKICEAVGFEFNISLDGGIFKFDATLSQAQKFQKVVDYVSYCLKISA
jgi:hypothetical protein